jgi:hypothetical protein
MALLPGSGNAIAATVAEATPDANAVAPAAQAHDVGTLGRLLAMPPLRARPEEPMAQLTGAPGLQHVAFAAAAGVAALRWKDHVRVVDVGTGVAIGDHGIDGAGQVSLSPNGRVLAVAGHAGDDAVQLRVAETGELLATLSDVQDGHVFWLDAQRLAHARRDASTLCLRDLAAGTQVALPFDGRGLAGMTPVPGQPDRFVAVSARRIAQLEWAVGAAPRLVRGIDRPGEPGRFDGDIALGPDGKLFFAGGTTVSVLDPATLAITSWSFAPLRIVRADPLPDPDLLRLGVHGSVHGDYAYSRLRHTLARLVDAPGGDARSHYEASLRREVAIDDATVRLLERPATDAPREVVDVIEQMEFEQASSAAETGERLARDGQSMGSSMTLGSGRFRQRKPAGAEGSAKPRR